MAKGKHKEHNGSRAKVTHDTEMLLRADVKHWKRRYHQQYAQRVNSHKAYDVLIKGRRVDLWVIRLLTILCGVLILLVSWLSKVF